MSSVDGTASHDIIIKITGTNDAPVAVADVAAGTENQTLDIDVLANDTDVDDGHVFTLVSAGAPTNKGAASVVANQVHFVPGTDFDHLAQGATEHVTLSYTMQDEFGAQSSSTVDVTITGTNDAPVAVADVAAGTENQTLDIDVLANDTDVDDGHVFTLVSAGAPTNKGAASVVANQVHFVPGTDFDHLAQGATEHVTLSYTMQDEFGAQSSSTVDVTITGTNDAPVAVADVAAGTENQTLDIDVLANDTDVDDGHVFTLVSAGAPTNKGAASVVANQVHFVPGTDFDHLAQGATEHVTLSYTMQDEFGAQSSSTVDVTITGTNDAPVAVADVAAGTENQTLDIDVLANDTDVDDGHVFTLVSAGAPTNKGAASVVANQVHFVPGTDFDHLAQGATEHVTLSYTMQDEFGAQSSSTVDVTITGTNDAPVAVADVAAGTENQTLDIDVLANDTDVDDGHVFTLVSAGAPTNKGAASVVANQVHFVPGTDFDHLAQGATEHVTLSYTMQDEFGAQSSSTVDVTITGTNDAPVAVADVAAGTENQTLDIDVLANDTDVDDGHVFTLVSAGAPTNKGAASVVANQVHFVPGTDFDHLAQGATEHVTLSYTMQDEFGAQSSSTVDVTITGTNDAPVAVADVAAGTENQTLDIDVLANDTDVDDGHVFTLVSAGAPTNKGAASVVANQVHFVPGTDFDHLAQGATEHVTLSYTMQDEFGAQSSSTVDVTITGTNDAPVLDASKTPVLASVNASAAAPSGAVGTLVSALVDFASPSGQVDNVTDADAGAVLGIALTATTGAGTWYYSLNGGTLWTAVGTVSNTSALLLAADSNTRVYYQSTSGGTITNAITFRAWDQTSGTAGGKVSTATNGTTTAFSTATDTANITVNATSIPPVVDLNGAAGGNDATLSYPSVTTPLPIAPSATITDAATRQTLFRLRPR